MTWKMPEEERIKVKGAIKKILYAELKKTYDINKIHEIVTEATREVIIELYEFYKYGTTDVDGLREYGPRASIVEIANLTGYSMPSIFYHIKDRNKYQRAYRRHLKEREAEKEGENSKSADDTED